MLPFLLDENNGKEVISDLANLSPLRFYYQPSIKICSKKNKS